MGMHKTLKSLIILIYIFGCSEILSIQVEENLRFDLAALKNLINEPRNLNISDFSLNTALFMLQRSFTIDILARNDSLNPLPIPIDTMSLSILVDEFNRFEPNQNMTLRIFENKLKHSKPRIVTDIDGINLNVQLGIEFGMENVIGNKFLADNLRVSNLDVILSMDVSIALKLQCTVRNNKLSLSVTNIRIKDIQFLTDKLKVNREMVNFSITNFLKVAVNGVKDQIENIDVVKIINDLFSVDFSVFKRFDIIHDYGFNTIILN